MLHLTHILQASLSQYSLLFNVMFSYSIFITPATGTYTLCEYADQVPTMCAWGSHMCDGSLINIMMS